MQILEKRSYEGPNLYANFRVIRLEIDLGPLEEKPSAEIPDFVECTLAERNYSFFKILGKNDSPNDFSFEEGKKLSLIRTAELTSSSDSSDSSEETNFYPNEL